MHNKIIDIETNSNKLQERVDELTSATSYDTVKSVISKIKQTLYANKDIPGLCAPQIGENLRLIVVRLSKTETERFKVFINPIIVSSEGLHLSRETNPSFPGKQFIIPRKDKIHVAYQTPDGHVSSESYVGAYAEVLQQLIEMLDGILPSDYGLDLDDVGGPEAFDSASDNDKSAMLALYVNTIKDNYDKLISDINNNPDLMNLNKTIDFMTGMILGNITPINPESETSNNKDNN